MALARKNLMVDAEQLAALAARRGSSESAAVRAAIEDALFAEEFAAALEQLAAVGYGEVPTDPQADDSMRPGLVDTLEEDTSSTKRARQR